MRASRPLPDERILTLSELRQRFSAGRASWVMLGRLATDYPANHRRPADRVTFIEHWRSLVRSLIDG